MIWFLVMIFILFLTSVVGLFIRLLSDHGGFFVVVFSDLITTLEFFFIVVVSIYSVCMLIESVLPRLRRHADCARRSLM